MTQGTVIYNSSENKTKELSNYYSKTHDSPHRYLAYRDIPKFIHDFVKGKRVLDLGAGTGASSDFLHELDLDVIGLDISQNMLEKARSKFPHIGFYQVDELTPRADYDLVFSSFVLLELPSKKEIINYLNSSARFLKENGIFIAITGSNHLYSLDRKWMTFDAHFKENQNLHSGDIFRLALKHPEMEFYDYYWEESDYLDCFKKSNLEIIQTHSPLGFPEESYPWEDEVAYSPFTIFIAQKTAHQLFNPKTH